MSGCGVMFGGKYSGIKTSCFVHSFQICGDGQIRWKSLLYNATFSLQFCLFFNNSSHP